MTQKNNSGCFGGLGVGGVLLICIAISIFSPSADDDAKHEYTQAPSYSYTYTSPPEQDFAPMEDETAVVAGEISQTSIDAANNSYAGYEDYIVTPSKADFRIEGISSDGGKVFVRLADQEPFNDSSFDATYGRAIGNTMSLLMGGYFDSGTTLIIESGDNITWTGEVL